MSRRALRTQLTITQTVTITPATTSGKNVVTPTRATVIEAARISGSMLGPGRWISSPAGGTSGSSGATRVLGDVDRRGHERHAEHEEADGGDDEPGADVLASE